MPGRLAPLPLGHPAKISTHPLTYWRGLLGSARLGITMAEDASTTAGIDSFTCAASYPLMISGGYKMLPLAEVPQSC
jgi:hypothetical protein